MEKSFHCYISQDKFDHSAEKYKPKTLGPLKQNAFLGQAMCMLFFFFCFFLFLEALLYLSILWEARKN